MHLDLTLGLCLYGIIDPTNQITALTYLDQWRVDQSALECLTFLAQQILYFSFEEELIGLIRYLIVYYILWLY